MLDATRLPQGWSVNEHNTSQYEFSVWKSFRDGIHVEILVSRNQQGIYTIRLEAEQDSLNSSEVTVAETPSLDEAVEIIYNECKYWEDELTMLGH